MAYDSKDLYYDVQNDAIKDKTIHDVPLVKATESNFMEYGRFVQDFDNEKVWITQWPTTGRRNVCEGTGVGGGEVMDRNINCWEENLIYNKNMAIEWGKFYHGCLSTDEAKKEKPTHVLTREANYHPDGGQVFFPTENTPFVALLALPGDDVTPGDFKAFYFDGSHGFQIKAGIWHQPMYTTGKAEFLGKQGAVFACVMVDTVKEFNTYLRVPLVLDNAVE